MEKSRGISDNFKMVSMEIKRTILFSFGIFLLLMIVGYFVYGDQLYSKKAIIINENPISKVSGVTFSPGEVYTYSIEQINGSESISTTISYLIDYGENCIIISSEEGGNSCINMNGNDEEGSNLTLESGVFFFKPWMLAVKEGWKWRVEWKTIFTDEILDWVEFETIGSEKIFGRDSYKVHVKFSYGESTKWIDKKKRVLLKDTGVNYVIEIINGPFPLEK